MINPKVKVISIAAATADFQVSHDLVKASVDCSILLLDLDKNKSIKKPKIKLIII